MLWFSLYERYLIMISSRDVGQLAVPPHLNLSIFSKNAHGLSIAVGVLFLKKNKKKRVLSYMVKFLSFPHFFGREREREGNQKNTKINTT